MSLLSAQRRDRLRYFGWAASHYISGDRTCPGCGGGAAHPVRRKYLVTVLYECPVCGLRFRVPKETPSKASRLYEEENYRQGFTTELPNQEQLGRLLSTSFAGTEKDFEYRISVLNRVMPGRGRLLDFGSSWGYGSWQMSRAGYAVFSYEVGRERSQYARERLGCNMVDDLRTLDGTIDCFFSAHVIEHLPDPNVLFSEAARLLVPGGYFVCFCPNGSPARDGTDPNYHLAWGQVHPLFITPQFIEWACKQHGFELVETLGGPELLAVARKLA
jgi:SAM-dependent methyltransferase